jgi:hypothetical protein
MAAEQELHFYDNESKKYPEIHTMQAFAFEQTKQLESTAVQDVH